MSGLPEHEQAAEAVGGVMVPLQRSSYVVHALRRNRDAGASDPDREPPGTYHRWRCGKCGFEEVALEAVRSGRV